MPIRQFLGSGPSFDRGDLALMGAAFSAALDKLALKDRTDPIVEIVARRIIRAALDGERDPERLREIGIEGIGGENKAV